MHACMPLPTSGLHVPAGVCMHAHRRSHPCARVGAHAPRAHLRQAPFWRVLDAHALGRPVPVPGLCCARPIRPTPHPHVAVSHVSGAHPPPLAGGRLSLRPPAAMCCTAVPQSSALGPWLSLPSGARWWRAWQRSGAYCHRWGGGGGGVQSWCVMVLGPHVRCDAMRSGAAMHLFTRMYVLPYTYICCRYIGMLAGQPSRQARAVLRDVRPLPCSTHYL